MIRYLAVVTAILLAGTASAQSYELVRQWPAPGGHSVAIDPNGSLFIGGGATITKYGDQGSVLGQFITSGPIEGIAVDHSGGIYSVLNGEIVKFDLSGNVLGSWAGVGKDGTPGMHDSGVAVDPLGNVYGFRNGSSGYRTIQRIDPTGSSSFSFGTLDSPFDLAIGPDGSVYATANDIHSDRAVTRYDASGSQLQAWGKPYYPREGEDPTPDGDFKGVLGIAVDPAGFVYVCDFQGRIQKFTATGEFVTKWSVPFPRDIAVAKDGQVYVLSESQDGLGTFAPSVLVYSPLDATPAAPASWGQLKARWAR